MHEGHRARLVGRVAAGGTLYPHEILEALLFPACPRKDMNPVAHRLLSKFKSLEGVFTADREELLKVEGVGDKISSYIYCLGKCLPHIGGAKSFALVRTTEQYLRFLGYRPADVEDELELCVCDGAGRVTRIITFRGKEGRRAEPTLAALIRNLVACRAHGVFAAYKHASGEGVPCREDDAVAMDIKEACRIGGVKYYDFVVLSPSGGAVSYFVTDRLNG